MPVQLFPLLFQMRLYVIARERYLESAIVSIFTQENGGGVTSAFFGLACELAQQKMFAFQNKKVEYVGEFATGVKQGNGTFYFESG
jgi:hypothetical protein